MASLGDGRGFDELLPHTENLGAGGLTVKVLDLPTLIEVKTHAGRAKDKAVLPLLLALLGERER
jgi:predicted nucleotidyltransferase